MTSPFRGLNLLLPVGNKHQAKRYTCMWPLNLLDLFNRGTFFSYFQSEAEKGPSVPHDIAVSSTGRDVYIADVLQQAVHKFNFTQPAADQKHFG